ncbi:histone-lysine N-methyltransferase SUVR3-like [Phalaenopsis equestris]|uniref:histone-lysine N-methyltransferase SUVR3-like n=1 Tax=Phalaenopsis equestris TaxID=78828 RepID=UPI0009E20ADE|nr:histone-lysine N-methyltransferase SUVR3-like [Phalaenopsis equestris]XP_020594268.1 histone-lysine N-methyltransferase SUVR3-like [Phalaenopsis equestris]
MHLCAGEFVTTEEARRRLHAYDELASTRNFSPALLVVREHLPSGKACLRVNIDATEIGNVARFINHSCDGGNLMVVLVRNSGCFLPRLCFFAAVDISEGEELIFSYGDAPRRPNGLPCFCGKEECMGVLPSEEA